MKHAWPIVKLGEVLQHRKNFITIDDGLNYRRPRVRLHAQGILLRDEVPGALIKTKKQQVCHSNEFLVAEIDAKVGGFGIVPKELEGSIVSSHYFLYTVVTQKLDVKYLDYFIRTAYFREQVEAQGTTNYAAIRPADVLQYEIPLPPLAEQQRIVVRIEELSSQLEEARMLRKQAVEEASQIPFAVDRRIWPEQSLLGAKRLDEVTSFLARGRQSEQGESNHYLIKTQHVQQCRYISTSMRLADHVAIKVKPEAQLQDNDILIACSAAGCIGRVAQYKDDGRVASTDTHVAIARANREIIDPEYLYAYLKGAQGQYQLRSRERGDWQREKISFRLAELNLNDLRQVPVPVPPFEEQKRIVHELHIIQSEVDQIKALHAETAAELDALLPALLDCAFKGEL